jgi:uncharacterized membrane protein
MKALPTARLLILLLVVLAYLPALSGGFLSDDSRFISQNTAVQELTPVRYFTDLSTQATFSFGGMYRPIRTFDFALDWAVSGGRPFGFHLKSVLLHAVAALLLLSLFARIFPEEKPGFAGPAFCGALLFALHPVHTEAVAWISSRGDLLSAVFFLGALLLHVKGRPFLALPVLLLALLSKESAVVFPAAVLLVDRLRRAPIRWGWTVIYGVLVGVYVGLWFLLVPAVDGSEVNQMPYYWGGSVFANAVTIVKSLLYYLKLLVLPVDLVTDYHLPARRILDFGGVVSIVCVTGVVGLALAAGRRGRFVLFWFLVTIFPVSNVMVRMLIPTAERFLYLPSVGFCLVAGVFLSKTRLRTVVYACFFVLVFLRSFAWQSDRQLWEATLRVAETPSALAHATRADLEIALETGDPADARKVLRRAASFFELYERDIHLTPEAGPPIVPLSFEADIALSRSRACLLLHRDREALGLAERAVSLNGPLDALLAASEALERLGRYAEAAAFVSKAMKDGYGDEDRLNLRIALLFCREGKLREDRGRREDALTWYQASWELNPDPEGNREAREGMIRLRR